MSSGENMVLSKIQMCLEVQCVDVMGPNIIQSNYRLVTPNKKKPR